MGLSHRTQIGQNRLSFNGRGENSLVVFSFGRNRRQLTTEDGFDSSVRLFNYRSGERSDPVHVESVSHDNSWRIYGVPGPQHGEQSNIREQAMTD